MGFYNFILGTGTDSYAVYNTATETTGYSFKENPLKESAIIGCIFLVYFLSGKLGLKLAFENVSATAVWAPTGIAIAAFLLRGYHVFPAILLGAFLINVTTTGHIATSLCIAAGNTSEGLLGAYLVKKYAGGISAFDDVGNIFRFAFLAGIVSTIVSATVGVTSLALWGFVQWTSYIPVWLTWWIGDAVGAFLVAPFLIIWFRKKPLSVKKRIPEVIAVLFILALVSFVEFSPYSIAAVKNYPISFVLIPPFVWIAFRFSQHFVSAAAFAMCAVAIWGTLNSYGPFVMSSHNDSLLILQSFIGLTAIMSLVFAAVIAKHNLSEEKLRKAERAKWEEFHLLLEKLPAGAYTCDKNGFITYYNEKAVKLWGREPKLNSEDDRFCGSSRLYLDNMPIDHSQCWMALAIKNNKEYYGEEIVIERPDGTSIEVLAHANPIVNKSGELVGAVNVLVDVSEMKKIQKALAEAYNIMEERVTERTAELRKTQAELIHSEKLASLGRFSAGIAHEIRNPLANISSLAQLLVKKNANPDIEKHLEYILINSNIANRIIKDLLNIASSDNSNLKRVNINLLLDNVCIGAEVRCEKNQIKLIKKLQENIPFMSADEDKLHTAFLNFISNAIDAMPGGGELKISAENDNSSNEVVISFEDTGIGIPEENLNKVLEPFFTTKTEGTGLGLTLAYNVVRSHSGRIEVESRKNSGTKFTIKLPVNQA